MQHIHTYIHVRCTQSAYKRSYTHTRIHMMEINKLRTFDNSIPITARWNVSPSLAEAREEESKKEGKRG